MVYLLATVSFSSSDWRLWALDSSRNFSCKSFEFIIRSRIPKTFALALPTFGRQMSPQILSFCLDLVLGHLNTKDLLEADTVQVPNSGSVHFASTVLTLTSIHSFIVWLQEGCGIIYLALCRGIRPAP